MSLQDELYNNLVRFCKRYEGEEIVEVVVPGWGSEQPISIPAEQIPQVFLDNARLVENYRCYADVTLGAEELSEFRIEWDEDGAVSPVSEQEMEKQVNALLKGEDNA